MIRMGKEPNPVDVLGTPEHAAQITDGRHPGVRDALQWLAFSHLPEKLQNFSRPFYQTAVELVLMVGTDSPELTTALNRLIEAKDSAMRAGIRHDTGRAGSVPRPQTVVEPPLFGSAQVPARADQRVSSDRPFPGRPIQDRPQA